MITPANNLAPGNSMITPAHNIAPGSSANVGGVLESAQLDPMSLLIQ